MEIRPVDAVSHVVNSLDNSHADYWYDEELDRTWHVRSAGDGVIEIVLIDDDDGEEIYPFRLVPVDEVV